MNHFSKLAIAAAAVGVTLSAQAVTLYNNGPVVNGAGLSVLTLPATTLGFGQQTNAGNAVADDFSVAAGQTWTVDTFNFYGYQTDSTAFTFTTATWSVVSGDVNTGTVIASGLSNVSSGGRVGYRVTSATLGSTARSIYSAVADVPNFSLGAGSYWLRWSLTGTLASGPWQPSTSDAAVGNARQSTPTTGGVFQAAVDDGSGFGVELPFTINGTVTAVPEPGTVSLMLAGGLAFAGLARRRQAR